MFRARVEKGPRFDGASTGWGQHWRYILGGIVFVFEISVMIHFVATRESRV